MFCSILQDTNISAPCTGFLSHSFNGKESDNEWSNVTGADLDFGARIYDARIGRFLSIDPVGNFFPWNSPYSYAENDAIRCIDIDGLEKYIVCYYYSDLGEVSKISIIRSVDIEGNVQENNIRDSKSVKITDKEVLVQHYYDNGKGQYAPTTSRDNLTEEEKKIISEEVTTSTPFYKKTDEKGNTKSFGGFTNGDIFTSGSMLKTIKTFDLAPKFKGTEVPKGSSSSFSETISFNSSSDVFTNESTVAKQLSELVTFLNTNKDASAFIVGNLNATDLSTGHGDDVLKATRCLNGNCDKTALDVMNARAKKVYDKLIDLGVDKSQLNYGAGNNYPDKSDKAIGLNTTFVIKR